MNDHLLKYFMKKVESSSVILIPGHLPRFESTKEIDEWIEATDVVKVYVLKRKKAKL